MSASPSGVTPAIALLENLPDGIVLIDGNGWVAYSNAAAEQLFGRPVSEMVGAPFHILLAEPFGEEYAGHIRRFNGGDHPEVVGQRRDVFIRRLDSSVVPAELTLCEVRDGGVKSLAAVAHDIGHRKQEETRLRRMASQDSLTGLVNRTNFERALSEHVDWADRYGNGGAVIALGVDTFQYVNEALGVSGGDEILVGLAELVKGRLRKTDVLARVDGDVFGILAPGTDREKALTLAEQLLDLVRRHSFVVNSEGIRVTLSAGVSSLNQRAVTGADFLAEAETAMHTAKESGRDRALAYVAHGHSEVDGRRAWSERVRQATERGLFVLVSQPIVNLKSEQATQHEVLLRMRDDGGGLVEPGSFLATAERFGLIGGIDRWVTQQAVRLIAAHNKEGRDLTLEVNLSGMTMGDSRFPAEVKRELTTSGIDPGCLVFEVTETAAIADIEQARKFALSLARLGCRFALDDFGAGYASFYYLKHMPISYLKIDGEFVRELPASHADQLIVRALVEVCGGLGIKTIAEFVTDQRTMDMVRDLGVDFAQGYHLGKPAPISELRGG